MIEVFYVSIQLKLNSRILKTIFIVTEFLDTNTYEHNSLYILKYSDNFNLVYFPYRNDIPVLSYLVTSFPKLRFKRDVLFGDLEMLGNSYTFIYFY